MALSSSWVIGLKSLPCSKGPINFIAIATTTPPFPRLPGMSTVSKDRKGKLQDQPEGSWRREIRELMTVPVSKDSLIQPTAKTGHASSSNTERYYTTSEGLLAHPSRARSTLQHRPRGTLLQLGAEQEGPVMLRLRGRMVLWLRCRTGTREI